MTEQASLPPNIPVSPYVARRLQELRDRMGRDLERQVTYTQVLERLIDIHDRVVQE